MESDAKSVFLLDVEERKNLIRSLELLGDTFALVSETERLYDTLPDLCRLPNDVETNDSTFAAGLTGSLLSICRRQLTIGTLTLLRGYANDSQIHLRRAIETCAFSARMSKHPHMARIWLGAGNSDEAFEKFRKTFVKLFPDDDAQLKLLGQQYDVCSKAMHSGIYGAAHHLSRPRRNAPGRSIDGFDVGTEGKLVTVFFVSVFSHMTILRVFERLLSPYAGSRISQWTEHLGALEGQYTTRHKEWMPVVKAEGERLKAEGLR